ncbi:MAG: hypothetical protein U5R48_12405 [Gammaproteobacteria bacterium]|nr:hypothetical protein [Gammaproteobacteria bacterium]
MAFIDRTMAEKHVGEYLVCAGVFRHAGAGHGPRNAQHGVSERIGQTDAINGHDRDNMPRLPVGDIGAPLS